MSQLLIGPLIAVLGYILWKRPPKKINNFYGYRTPRSMKSQEAWDYANKYSAYLMCLLGIVTSAVQTFAYLISDHVSAIIAGTSVLVVGLVIMIFHIETELKKKIKK